MAGKRLRGLRSGAEEGDQSLAGRAPTLPTARAIALYRDGSTSGLPLHWFHDPGNPGGPHATGLAPTRCAAASRATANPLLANPAATASVSGQSQASLQPPPTLAHAIAALRWTISAAIAVIGIAALLFGFNVQNVAASSRNPAVPVFVPFAVLPLVNLPSDPAQEYCSEGTTDELITELAKFGDLRVISDTSVERYKQVKTSLPEIARELVRLVLRLVDWGCVAGQDELFAKSKAAAQRAAALDPGSATAHAEPGELAFYRDWNWPASKRNSSRR